MMVDFELVSVQVYIRKRKEKRLKREVDQTNNFNPFVVDYRKVLRKYIYSLKIKIEN